MSTESKRTVLYPKIEPNVIGRLTVSPLHELYWEEAGNPKGLPVVVNHGGPGGGSSPSYRQYFDPAVYRIINYDQRGSGKSTPHACLKENTTWLLVDDIEILRKHLGIEKWGVFGGSWGSTLSLAYAQKYPERVICLVLRGIFTLRRSELEFFYQEGSSWMFPEEFEAFQSVIPVEERNDMITAYYKRLSDENKDVKSQMECAKEWTKWEMATSKLHVNKSLVEKAADSEFALAFARIESHFFKNGGFMEDGDLIKNADIIKDIPGIIVQGRYDMVCPAKTAYDLKKNWPKAELHMIPDAGHSCSEAGTISELVKATDKFAAMDIWN